MVWTLENCETGSYGGGRFLWILKLNSLLLKECTITIRWNPVFLYKISPFTISQSSIMHSSDPSAYFPRLANKLPIAEFELSLQSPRKPVTGHHHLGQSNSRNISPTYISCKININIILTIIYKILQILSSFKLLRLNVAGSMVVPPVSPFQI